MGHSFSLYHNGNNQTALDKLTRTLPQVIIIFRSMSLLLHGKPIAEDGQIQTTFGKFLYFKPVNFTKIYMLNIEAFSCRCRFEVITKYCSWWDHWSFKNTQKD